MRRAFTIVELLVTVGIIALLAGLLLAGIGSARGAAQARRQASDLRQLHVAWTMYADQANGSVLPGFIETKVQEAWKIRAKAPAKVPGTDSDRLPREVSQSYPWRLMPCMDHAWDVMMDQRPGEATAATAALAAPWASSAGAPDPLGTIAALPEDTPGRTVALQPAFGYNAWHIGGVWRARAEGPPRLAFGDARAEAAIASTLGTSTTASLGVVVQKLAAARLPDRLTIFCPSTVTAPGAIDAKPRPDTPGSPIVVGPSLAEIRVWERSATEEDGMQVLTSQSVPVRRDRGALQRVTLDGAVAGTPISDLADLRCWIDLPAWPEGPQPGPVFRGTP